MFEEEVHYRGEGPNWAVASIKKKGIKKTVPPGPPSIENGAHCTETLR